MVLKAVVDGAAAAIDSKFDINEFRSSITGFHKTAHFNMVITPPSGLGVSITRGAVVESEIDLRGSVNMTNVAKTLPFYIEATELPGISLATDEVRRYGLGNFDRKPYVTTFKELDVVVRSDSMGQNHNFFKSWLKYMVNFDVDSGRTLNNGFNKAAAYEVQYKANYSTTGDIICFDNEGNQLLGVRIVDLYPIYLSPISLNWSDNNIAKFQVKFSYAQWNYLGEFHGIQTDVVVNQPR